MSPFSIALRTLRARFELAQGEFAARLGYRQAYVSALECGTKLPKEAELVRKIVDALDLDSSDEASLQEAFEASRHFNLPPPGAPAAAYRLCAQFSEILPTLSPVESKALSAMLDVFQRSKRAPGCAGSVPAGAEEKPM